MLVCRKEMVWNWGAYYLVNLIVIFFHDLIKSKDNPSTYIILKPDSPNNPSLPECLNSEYIVNCLFISKRWNTWVMLDSFKLPPITTKINVQIVTIHWQFFVKERLVEKSFKNF